MSIHGLFIGCDYKGEAYELPDCEEFDAMGLADAFEPYLQTGKVLIGPRATRKGMLAGLSALKANYRAGDLALVSFSGHGTTDKVGGKKAQAIVCNDGTLLYEFELRQLLADLGLAAMLADSCYSGGLTRSMHRARTIPASYCFRQEVEIPSRMAAKPHALYLACRAGETAASTGKGGAMTLAILEAFAERKAETSFESLGKRVKQLLPTDDYPQHPQFECADKAFARRTIQSFSRKQKSQ